MDHQAGHNSETARARYGITNEDMDQLTPEKLLGFFHASRQWHRQLGFSIKQDQRKSNIEKAVGRNENENKM